MSDRNDTGSLEPNLRLGDSRQQRYPSPFFDVSQQYMPPTMKELFKWCYFYATTNSLIGPALKKVARYPVTDLVWESKSTDVAEQYKYLFNRTLKIKAFLMETNLDLHVYGNSFVSMYYPFTRFVECRSCEQRELFKTANVKITPNLKIDIKCKKCGIVGEAKIHDVTYRSKEKVRLLRLNPENIDIKYNDASGEHNYAYNIPDKLKRMLVTGEKEIFESTPLVYIEAIKKKVKIRLNPQNLFHLKNPTVAGKDFGFGIPTIAPVLKDLYYYYSLRRAQEAIMNEHITPLDVISPAPNGQMDPYVHSNLSNFKKNVAEQIARHRRDPNYKAILPFPIQHQRVGGDGKAMLLQGELDFLSQIIIGGMGIPKEFVYGGLNWTGSSVSLRTLENEFFHHRSQLLDLVYWAKDKMRIYLDLPDVEDVRFLDFKMADDIQRLTLVGNLETAGKISTSTYLTELGYDFEQEQQKRLKESDLLARVQERMQIQATVSQGKVNEMNVRSQIKINELMANAQATSGIPMVPGEDGENPGMPTMQGAEGGASQGANTEGGGGAGGGQSPGQEQPGQGGGPSLDKTVNRLADQIIKGDPAQGQNFLQQLTSSAPALAELVKKRVNEKKGQGMLQAGSAGKSTQGTDMRPLPNQRAPTRQGSV